MNRLRSISAIASLETQVKAHATQLDEHDAKLEEHAAWLNQVKGMFRTLVVLWVITTTILGLVGVKFAAEVVMRPASYQVTKVP
jgi:hypothetical protein